MSVRAVLFDLGQTLLEYPGNTHEFWSGYLKERLAEVRATLSDMGAQVEGTADAFADRAVGIVWPERKINMSGRSWHFGDRMRALLAAYGREECTDEECEALTNAFYKPIGEATRRYPETLEVLEGAWGCARSSAARRHETLGDRAVLRCLRDLGRCALAEAESSLHGSCGGGPGSTTPGLPCGG